MTSAQPTKELPAAAWRVLWGAAVGLLLAAVILIALISAGLFDPRTAGPLQQTLAPKPLSLAPGERAMHWLQTPPPPPPFSVRLLAAHGGGDPDAAYGLALGDGDAAFFVAVSAAGYVSIWQEGPQATLLTHMPWQTWPHLRDGVDANEIAIDVWGEALTVRLNRELLWQGESPFAPTTLGHYAKSFAGAAQIDFRTLSLYYESAP